MLPTCTQAYCYVMPFGVYQGHNLWSISRHHRGKQYLIDLFFGPYIDACSPHQEVELRRNLRTFLWYHRF